MKPWTHFVSTPGAYTSPYWPATVPVYVALRHDLSASSRPVYVATRLFPLIRDAYGRSEITHAGRATSCLWRIGEGLARGLSAESLYLLHDVGPHAMQAALYESERTL